MDTLVALETGNNILGSSLLDNFIIPYHNAATFQTACFQLQRNNQKHATVFWQLKKIKVVWDREQEDWKPTDLWSSILQTVHYNNESMIGRVSRSVAVYLAITQILQIWKNQFQI